MAALADRNAYTAWNSVPTGALYRMPVAEETVVEPVPGVDADALLGRLHGQAAETTDFTILGERVTGIKAGRAATVGALLGASLLLIGSPTLYEPTPFTIEVGSHARGSVSVQAAPEDVSARTDPAAYRAFKDLGRWLDAEDGQIADMVGIGRTTPYTWKREGREPRAATAQHIYEHHATLDALQRRLGVDGLRRWLHEGVPPRRDAVLAGDLASLERDVHEVLFRRPVDSQIDLAAAPEGSTAAARAKSPAVRPSGRRPRRAAT